MSVEKVHDGQLVCKCERCKPPKVWMPKGNKMPSTCPQCRSKLWNKKKQEIKAVKEGEIPQVALICAIVQKFSCIYYEDKKPCTPVCNTCFTLPVWKDQAKIDGLMEAFDFGVVEVPEPVIDIEEAIEGTEDKVIQTKTAEQIMAELEAREIKEPEPSLLRDGELPPVSGGNKVDKVSEKLKYTAAARTCGTKSLDAQGKWQCNFFTHKSASPPFPYCGLCWELPIIWGKRAVGYKEK